MQMPAGAAGPPGPHGMRFGPPAPGAMGQAQRPPGTPGAPGVPQGGPVPMQQAQQQPRPQQIQRPVYHGHDQGTKRKTFKLLFRNITFLGDVVAD